MSCPSDDRHAALLAIVQRHVGPARAESAMMTMRESAGSGSAALLDLWADIVRAGLNAPAPGNGFGQAVSDDRANRRVFSAGRLVAYHGGKRDNPFAEEDPRHARWFAGYDSWRAG